MGFFKIQRDYRPKLFWALAIFAILGYGTLVYGKCVMLAMSLGMG